MQFQLMRHADLVASQLALRQHGTFSRWQLLPRGISPRSIARRLNEGYWLLLHPGVYALAGSGDTFERRLWAGGLAVGPDALVSHEAAAQVHGVPHVIRNKVVLTNAHGWHHRLEGVTVHQLDDVLTEHRTGVNGLPVTTRARTIVDLAAVVHPARLLPIVEATH